MNDLEQKLQQAQQLVNAINVQRKSGVESLRERVLSLQNDMSKVTIDNLASPVLVSNLRTMINALNATLQGVEAHDKLIDFLIADLGGALQRVRSNSETLIELSIGLESMMRVLVDNNSLSLEDFRVAQEKLMSELRENRAIADSTPDSSEGESVSQLDE
jgi:hypothetical protein